MKTFTLLLLLTTSVITFAQQNPSTSATENNKMEWFNDAKLGIFIHYGIYAVDGVQESWAFYNNDITYDKYMNQLSGFTAKNYDPNKWADLFKEAGAKYAVLTTKHHDGVALWDTKYSDLNVVKKTPAGRDLVTPFVDAMRKANLKVGIYYSHPDWSHPDYAAVYHTNDTLHINTNKFDYASSGIDDTVRWNRFREFHQGQLKELADLTNPDLWWFDGDWTRRGDQWEAKKIQEMLLDKNPNVIINSRLSGYGDYSTPEQGIPIFGPKGPWELCMTINDSWGYKQSDTNFKSTNYIIRVFSDCISLGGNLLLDVGPKEDGTITPEQTKVLKELGRWTNKHAEAIYSTRKGLPFGHYFGPSTISKDKKTVYLFILDNPKGDIVLKGLKNKVKSMRVVGTNQTLNYQRNGGHEHFGVPGTLLINVPTKNIDKNVTVIAIELETPLDLYRGEGRPIEQN